MFESIFTTTTSSSETVITLSGLLIALVTSLVLGIAVSLVYMKTHKDRNHSQSFALTLVMLPAIITIIIMLVGSNIARAFSLGGVFAIIRFRSAPGDPKDIAFVLFTTSIGLACGMGYMGYAIVVCVVLCAAMLLLELTKFGKVRSNAKILKITIPENLDYQDAFDSILSKYTLSSTLQKVKTTDLGSLYELHYSITTKPDIRDRDFIDELRCRNGNLNITLILTPQSGEY